MKLLFQIIKSNIYEIWKKWTNSFRGISRSLPSVISQYEYTKLSINYYFKAYFKHRSPRASQILLDSFWMNRRPLSSESLKNLSSKSLLGTDWCTTTPASSVIHPVDKPLSGWPRSWCEYIIQSSRHETKIIVKFCELSQRRYGVIIDFTLN